MAEHSPTPWRVEIVNRTFHVDAADGGFVALFVSDADAAYIVEAVNDYEWAIGEIHKMTVEHDELFDEAVEIRKERDRLRNIMRGLVAILDTITLEDHEIALLDEAREALGEGEP